MGDGGLSERDDHPWWMPLGIRAGTLLLGGLGRSWRIERRGVREYDRVLEGGERCIFAFWHARMLPLVYTHRRRAIGVLVSRHRDGEWIARIIERLGFLTARGSSTRGGEEGMRDLLDLAERRHLLAITPDGPRGPKERVKSGLVYLASRTGFPVVPVATAGSRAWVLSSWDHFRVPWPFARVIVAYGDPLTVPRDLSGAAVEAWRLKLERAIAALTEEVARLAGEGA